jgi:hypothetical protein
LKAVITNEMFGVPIEAPVNVFGDNVYVINLSQKPEAALTKKHNSITHHKIRVSVVSGISKQFAECSRHSNQAVTKSKT